MKKSIAMELAAVLAEDGFSLDELVVKTKLLFERDGMAGFVSLLLELVDAWLCRQIVNRGSDWHQSPAVRLRATSCRTGRNGGCVPASG